MAKQLSEFVTPREAAAARKVSLSLIYLAITRGDLQPVHPGTSLLRRADVEKLILRQAGRPANKKTA